MKSLIVLFDNVGCTRSDEKESRWRVGGIYTPEIFIAAHHRFPFELEAFSHRYFDHDS